MDECHHAGAYTFENVLWKVKAKYVYGLTATGFGLVWQHELPLAGARG